MPFLKPFSKTIPRSRRLEKAAQRNGFRHAIFEPDGSKYIGEWKNDKRSGKGLLVPKDGTSIYEGSFRNNVPHGFGTSGCLLESTNTENSTIVRGKFVNGKLGLNGLTQQRDGTYYKGILKNGLRDGYGCLWYANGNFYAGDFIKDKCHGLGMFVYMNGNRYEGEWKNGLKHGKGRFFHLNNGTMQEGVWLNDICVSSTIVNIPFRARAFFPTPYPIQNLNVTEVIVENDVHPSKLTFYVEEETKNGK